MTTRFGSLLLVPCLVALVGCADAASEDDCAADSRCDDDETGEADEVALRGAPPASFVTVTGNPSPGGAGTVTAQSSNFRARCAGASCTVPPGARVTLSASPAAGYRFERWSGCANSTNTTLSLAPRTSATCTANFARVQYTVVARAGTLGTVSASTQGVACPGSVCRVDTGANVTLSAFPAAGATFVNWSGCAGLASGLTLTLTNVRSDATCTANFQVILR